MKSCLTTGALAVATLMGLTVGAEIIDRPGGLKIGERMTLRPSVSTSFSYDSNVRSTHDSDGDCLWTIAPALNLHYNSENWSLLVGGYYNYHQYFKSENKDYNHHSYGEDFRWNWANSAGAEKGWSLILGQSFKQITHTDDMVTSTGQNYSGDTRQIQLAAAVQRRFSERWHGDANADYYWLDYDGSTKSLGSYYGWDRWRVGAEAGYAPSQWTDILLSGSYQGYTQENTSGTGLSGDSTGYTFQMGLGSYMTERISYRLLAGWSRFDYAGESSSDGFVYTATANWKIGETWNMMFLGTSYYQPSERQQTSESRVDALSWGVSKLMVRGKLRGTFDIRYRRETNEYVLDSDYDYVLDIITTRLGLSYMLNRFLSVYANIEYQKSMNDEASSRQNAYDYDRWRGSVGLQLNY